MKTAFLNHANAINNEAQALLAKLQLFPRWQAQGGEPALVGALACGLALAPDIDMEVYFDAPTPAQGFEVLKACAGTPGLRAARFRDEMDGPDQGYYWRLDVLSEGGTLWKVDMWPTITPGRRAARWSPPCGAPWTTRSVRPSCA